MSILHVTSANWIDLCLKVAGEPGATNEFCKKLERNTIGLANAKMPESEVKKAERNAEILSYVERKARGTVPEHIAVWATKPETAHYAVRTLNQFHNEPRSLVYHLQKDYDENRPGYYAIESQFNLILQRTNNYDPRCKQAFKRNPFRAYNIAERVMSEACDPSKAGSQITNELKQILCK